MMKSKKGFTVVELLATIVLLGVVLTIALLSISSISESVQKAQRENIISNIKVAAKRYVSDTDVKKVFVETLIKEGFIEADDENEQIIAPDTKESLNCYYVDYTGEEAEFRAGSVNESTGTCNYDLISDAILSMKYCAVTTGGVCGNSDYQTIPSGWINAKGKDIYLKVNNVPEFLNGADYKWISPLAPDLHYEGTVHKVEIPSKQYIDDVYQVIAYKDGKPYTAEARIKIDLKDPRVQDIAVNDAEIWTTSKTISATISDNESGLKSYKITRETEVPTEGWIDITGTNEDIAQAVIENGTYYIWVKDNAGNTNKSTIGQNGITIDKVDGIPPTCANGGDNDEWTASDVTIWWGCEDDESGCDASYSGSSRTFSTTTKTATIESYIIKDKVGNTVTCPARSADVYVDKTAPSCTNSGDSISWTKNSRTIYYGCSDDESGCNDSYSGGSKTFSTTTKTATISSYTIKDKVGNSKNCNSRTANVYVDTTVPTCTNSGDSTNWTNGSRKITWSCSDAESGCDESYDGDSKTYTTTTKTATINSYTIKDNAGNTTACASRTANVYVDTTDPTCTNSGDSTNWTSDSRTIYWGCSDSHSGCDTSYDGSSKQYATTTKTSSISAYTIKDNAGNSKKCNSRTANVYVDKTAPTISSFTISSTKSYNSRYAKLRVKGSDAHSGVSEVCITTSSSSSGCTWYSFSGDYTTSYTFAGSEGSGNRYKLYAFIKDVMGNVSSSKLASYTLYETCDETYIYDYGSWGDCSATCGGGYYYRDVYYYDYYFDTYCYTADDGSQSSYQCNTQACCDEGTYEYDYCSDDGYKVYSRYNGCLGYTQSYESYEACASEDYYCYWTDCDGSYEYYICYYYYGGVSKSYTYTYNTCENLDTINDYRWDTNCNEYYITTCDSTYCNYTYLNGSYSTGTVYRNNLRDSTYYNNNCVTSSVSICDIDGDTLFGRGKGSIAGNYGTWYSSVYQYYCYSGSGCYRTNGYDRVCASSECGSYKGMTAKQINTAAGCSFGRYWCSCSHTGQF